MHFGTSDNSKFAFLCRKENMQGEPTYLICDAYEVQNLLHYDVIKEFDRNNELVKKYLHTRKSLYRNMAEFGIATDFHRHEVKEALQAVLDTF